MSFLCSKSTFLPKQQQQHQQLGPLLDLTAIAAGQKEEWKKKEWGEEEKEPFGRKRGRLSFPARYCWVFVLTGLGGRDEGVGERGKNVSEALQSTKRYDGPPTTDWPPEVLIKTLSLLFRGQSRPRNKKFLESCQRTSLPL